MLFSSFLSKKLENFTKVFLPEPPIPINIALPLGYFKILKILKLELKIDQIIKKFN